MSSILQTQHALSSSSDEASAVIFSKMTFLQKWEQVCKLREIAWAMNAAGTRARRPDWTEEEIQNHVRLVFLYATT